MMHGALGAFIRWVGATFVGIGVVIGGAMVHTADPLALALIVSIAVLAPLVIARLFPKFGSWLAAAMLVSAPFALLMILSATNDPLILSSWRCGTGTMGLWLFVMPIVQAIFALASGPLWGLRSKLGPVWRPTTILGLGTAACLLLPGTYRYAMQGSADHGDSIVDRAHSQSLPATSPNTTVIVEVSDLVVRRKCESETCELSVGPIGTPPEQLAIHSSPLRASAEVTIHQFKHWRIIEGESSYGRGPSYRMVFDLEADRPTDLEVRDVAPWFGPSANALALLLLAAATVLGSTLAPSMSPLVWRRLGARHAVEDNTLEEVVALRSMHVAVLVVASLPLLAYAWLGTVF